MSQPWRIIIYFDEVTPTDPTSTKEDKHKIHGFYLTFVEFFELIYDEKVWFIVTCSASVDVELLETGMSQLVKHVLKTCFFNE